MDVLLIAACCLAGLVIGKIVGFGGGAAGLFAGLFLGIGWIRLRGLSARVDLLQSELQRLAGVRRTPASPLPATAAVAGSALSATASAD
ncbi:MAG: hypothetical protein ABIY56_08610, partial [Dokdonella sp.]